MFYQLEPLTKYRQDTPSLQSNPNINNLLCFSFRFVYCFILLFFFFLHTLCFAKDAVAWYVCTSALSNFYYRDYGLLNCRIKLSVALQSPSVFEVLGSFFPKHSARGLEMKWQRP